MKTILALDLGTNMGWAIPFWDSHVDYSKGVVSSVTPVLAKHPISGTVCFKNDRYQGGGMRYLKFNKWLDEIHSTYSFEEVCFEEVRARQPSVAADHAYGGFMATLTAWCEEKKIPYEGVPVGTIKKFITGKGNANKKAVMDAVRERGYNPKDDNEADALALLLLKLESE